ncbi:tannase and feruloyl esterase [Bisporella sp. PMI_857]|nr:tannase and feruloyl esterase [Bisporella sp. PMI_857]
MKFSSNASVWASVLLFSDAQSSVLPKLTQNCSTLTESLAQSFAGKKVTIINTALIPANSTSGNEYEYCQVIGKVAYTSNNTLNFNVYLPDATAYTGRFMAVGNGGMAGTIDTRNMMLQLNKGFAVAGGDSGHLAALNNNGSGSPGVYLAYMHDLNQVEAWIHNAISTFTEPAKSIIEQYYGTPVRYSYYDGCSTGGAQGFALAQFHPELFDGIYAGSPGNWYSHLALSFLWNAVKTQGAANIPQTTLDFMTAAVLEECDTLDGVKDNMLENPLQCKFEINTLACSSSSTNSSNCLTLAQLEAVKAIYAGPTSSLDGSELYPGFSVGSEASWLSQEGPLANAFSIPILQNMVFDDLSYDFLDFNWGSDVVAVDENAGRYIDEISTDLSLFRNRGGKLLVTQGWADTYTAAIWPIQHLQDLETFFGGDISDFFNVFMVPGGGHCGPAFNYPASPGTYHIADALISWVEGGEKPASVLSTGTMNGRGISRKLCPWPQTATYIGGDINVASSYFCESS